jgi:(heptosyl)LPS beta-1,4-glucosyltransferase
MHARAMPMAVVAVEPARACLPLSAVIITKNEADRIGRCVDSLISLCDEVLVLDSGSTDRTVPLARAAGARVQTQDWLGFAAQKNAVIAMARNPWILLLDADEWLGDGAEATIAELFASDRVNEADIWALERRTHFLGKALRFGGWGREAVERLFRKPFRYSAASVHERLDLAGAQVAMLGARIEHDTARSETEYRQKLTSYARLFAEQRHAQGKHASLASPASHAFFYVLKNGILRGGFLDGPTGWRYHLAHARYVWQKYRMLRSLAHEGPAPGKQ